MGAIGGCSAFRSFVRLVVLAIAGTGALVAGPAAAAAAQIPATLTGEVLGGTSLLPGYQQSATVSCDFDGSGVGTGTLTVSGVATGPYPGTFTETMNFRTQQSVPYNGTGTVTQFNASFTIDSPAGQVSGTKSLGSPTQNFALCFPPGGPGTGASIQISIDGAQYDARIQTPSGTYDDHGTTIVHIQDRDNTANYPLRLQDSAEIFNSSLLQPVLEAPTSADQCKNGGWKNYTALGFKNQGDCVSYVATKGKNPPSGS